MILALLAVALLLTGCSTTAPVSPSAPRFSATKAGASDEYITGVTWEEFDSRSCEIEAEKLLAQAVADLRGNRQSATLLGGGIGGLFGAAAGIAGYIAGAAVDGVRHTPTAPPFYWTTTQRYVDARYRECMIARGYAVTER